MNGRYLTWLKDLVDASCANFRQKPASLDEKIDLAAIVAEQRGGGHSRGRRGAQGCW